MRTLLLGLCTTLLLLVLTSCVSAGKYKKTVGAYNTQVDSLRQEVSNREGRINTLNFELARTQGANSALLTTQDKLQDRIDELQAEIDRMNQRIANNRQDFSGQLASAEAEQNRLRDQINQVRKLIQDREAEAATIAEAIRDSLSKRVDANSFSVETRGGQTVINLSEELLFRSGATTTLQTKRQNALQAIGIIVQRYPVQTVQVIGHTDNRQAVRGTDNWQTSATRAVTVVRYLTENTGLGPNRVLAAGKSEFAPRQSNDTTEGRAANRRMEISVQPRETDLIRDMNRIMAGTAGN